MLQQVMGVGAGNLAQLARTDRQSNNRPAKSTASLPKQRRVGIAEPCLVAPSVAKAVVDSEQLFLDHVIVAMSRQLIPHRITRSPIASQTGATRIVAWCDSKEGRKRGPGTYLRTKWATMCGCFLDMHASTHNDVLNLEDLEQMCPQGTLKQACRHIKFCDMFWLQARVMV